MPPKLGKLQAICRASGVDLQETVAAALEMALARVADRGSYGSQREISCAVIETLWGRVTGLTRQFGERLTDTVEAALVQVRAVGEETGNGGERGPLGKRAHLSWGL